MSDSRRENAANNQGSTVFGYDKEKDKLNYATESSRPLEAADTSKALLDGKNARKALTDKSKASSIFAAPEPVQPRGIKTTIKNDVERAPRGEYNEAHAAAFVEAKNERAVQQAKDKGSSVFWYDKEKDKATYETDSKRSHEAADASKALLESKSARKALTDKSKASSIFSQAGNEVMQPRGIKTTVKNERERAPRGEHNEEHAAAFVESKKERAAQQAKDKRSTVFDDSQHAPPTSRRTNPSTISTVFDDPLYLEPAPPRPNKKAPVTAGNNAPTEAQRNADIEKNSRIFETGTKFDNIHTNPVEGASPKKFVRNAARTESEEALFETHREVMKQSAQSYQANKSKDKANGGSSESILCPPEHEKHAYVTESMRTLEASDSWKALSEGQSARKAFCATSKGSSIFAAEDNTASAQPQPRGKRTTFRNEPERAPRGPHFASHAASFSDAKREMQAQQARGMRSEVLGFGGGLYAEEATAERQHRPVQATAVQSEPPKTVPAEQSGLKVGQGEGVSMSANKAKRQVFLAGSGPLW